jgi:hypothetical protein
MTFLLCGVLTCCSPPVTASLQATEVIVAFDRHVRDWDGFGAHYVEVRHTRDYDEWPQDYGGFKYLTEQEKQEVMDLLFGDDGLRINVLKMFLDPYHEPTPDNDDHNVINMAGFQHARTTENMRYFARQALHRTRARGEEMQVLAGLYGAPGWAVKQGDWGRDLIPGQKYELAEYMIAWAKYLRDVEKLPVRYLSLHNEEEGTGNWDTAGYPKDDLMASRLDRSMHWPKEQIADFLTFMREMLDRQGMQEVGLTPGETASWRDLGAKGIADEIAGTPSALNNLALITSHGFLRYDAQSMKFEEASYAPGPIDTIRKKRPELHAWTTSGKLDGYDRDVADIGYMEQFYLQIYITGVNGIIPWALVHCPWEADRLQNGGSKLSGNRNAPIHVIRTSETTGYYEIRKGYYFYKQLTRAGRPGMKVAETQSTEKRIKAIAFSKGKTSYADSFLLINTSSASVSATVQLKGTDSPRFSTYTTSEVDAGNMNCEFTGRVTVSSGTVSYVIPAKSSVLFVERELNQKEGVPNEQAH